jgi:hypothetical protein
MGWKGFKFQQVVGIFLFTTMSRLALGPSQDPVLLILWALPLGENGWGVKLTTYLHLVPRSRMHGAILLLSQYTTMECCSVKISTGTSNIEIINKIFLNIFTEKYVLGTYEPKGKINGMHTICLCLPLVP